MKATISVRKILESLTEWGRRDVKITDSKGNVIFDMEAVEAPVDWSDQAVGICASKYFRRGEDAEYSVKDMIERVVSYIVQCGNTGGYFKKSIDEEKFTIELCDILVKQKASFNSPVWFNVGREDRPMCSACFINPVEDSIDSIMDLVKTEGRIFKNGSGSGVNLSTLRASCESVSGGGTASGPIEFMKIYDSNAAVVKSGGRARRAAMIRILDVDHPDILKFICCKSDELEKAKAMIKAGFDGSMNGDVWESVNFQNMNISVRVTDAFMESVAKDKEWFLLGVKDKTVKSIHTAKSIFRLICEHAHRCGDPGLQFHDTINRYNMVRADGVIRSSNPCSEYMFLDNSACNLASVNLERFLCSYDDGTIYFDNIEFSKVCEAMITAQDILVDNAGYPTREIAENSSHYRPLGLGYTGLGAVLMILGIPYGSDESMHFTTMVTASMTLAAFKRSLTMANEIGPFAFMDRNRENVANVLRMYGSSLNDCRSRNYKDDEGFNDTIDRTFNANLSEAAVDTFDYMSETIRKGANSIRNAQVTLLAPTGTISLMMGSSSTGIEPVLGLSLDKSLVGGGSLFFDMNPVVRAFLHNNSNYTDEERHNILLVLEKGDTSLKRLRPEDRKVFKTALSQDPSMVISPIDHIRVMSAAQPYLSGAISKTVNLPHEATVEDVEHIFMQAYMHGLKSVCIFRDGCREQPVKLSGSTKEEEEVAHTPKRKKLPDERSARVVKFHIGGMKGYLHVGEYPDGKPGEVFITMARSGSTMDGLMDTIATLISFCLQYGVPLEDLVRKFRLTSFEPYGATGDKDVPLSKSVVDYVFRKLASMYLNGQVDPEDTKVDYSSVNNLLKGLEVDMNACPKCGSVTYRIGTCQLCVNCGESQGCS